MGAAVGGGVGMSQSWEGFLAAVGPYGLNDLEGWGLEEVKLEGVDMWGMCVKGGS